MEDKIFLTLSLTLYIFVVASIFTSNITSSITPPAEIIAKYNQELTSFAISSVSSTYSIQSALNV